MLRGFSVIDKVIIEVDKGLSTLTANLTAHRPTPAAAVVEDTAVLTTNEQKQSAAMMRVNHSGEICAQGLYRGQMVLAKNTKTKQMLAKAAEEEVDHLVWTEQRIKELHGHCSYLNGFWYLNSFLMGVLAAACADKYSLGFVEETEKQVGEHLQRHLGKLPKTDSKSQAILQQMHEDELHHGAAAKQAGGEELPEWVKKLMALHGRVMTTLSYYL